MSCQQEMKKNSVGKFHATDSRGKSISLAQPAQKVAVLFEPMVDEFYMLEAGKQIVGLPESVYQNESTMAFLSTLDNRIAEKKIATPTYNGRMVNIETIVGLAPDLAVVYEQDKEVIAQLEELGIPVFAVSSLDKNKIYDEFRGVAKLLDKEARSETLLKYVDKELEKLNHGGHNVKKAYYAWSKGRIFSTSGKGTLVDLAITSAGLENACPLELEAPNIGAESIYRWNPDLIILWNSQLKDVYELKELADLPAVKNKQVFQLLPTFNYDPHTLKFMIFAKQIHNWSYKDKTEEELQKEIQTDLEVLYNIKKQ